MNKIVYIGVGSNLDTPDVQIDKVLSLLKQTTQVRIISCSSKYFTKPMGPQDQPDYVNIVFKAETNLKPLELLDYLQSVEDQMGRDRCVIRWGARIIDLDILLIDDFAIDCDRLTVPHKGMTERSFVLCPLSEIEPDLIIPGYGKVETLAQSFFHEILRVQK